MRKGKVAAAILCLFSAGMLGGVTFSGNELSVARADQSDQILEVTEEAVTTATSIETTALVTTATSAKAKPVTTAAATTVTAKSTTATTSKTTAATTTDTSATTKTETTTKATTAAPAEPVTEPVPVATEAPVITTCPETEASESAPQTDAAEQYTSDSFAISVTDREYIMLCNVVGHEYGSDWVPEAEKALVAEVVMNRVNSPQFPNSIYDVLMQPNQFTGLEYLVEMDHMSSYVTQSVRDAVDLYLSNPSQFQHGYLFFNGDGYRNYFRATC